MLSNIRGFFKGQENQEEDDPSESDVKQVVQALQQGDTKLVSDLLFRKKHKYLNLFFPEVTVGDVELLTLAKVLQSNKTLRDLSILIKQGVESPSITALANALRNNNTLTNLCIYSKEKISHTCIKAFAEALKVNKSLTDLTLKCSIDDADVTVIAGALKQNKALIRLFLAYNKICDKGVEQLASALRVNKTLRMLNLEDNQITDVGGKVLAKLVTNDLTDLNLKGNQISDTVLKDIKYWLKQNREFEELQLNKGPFDDCPLS